jgi:hypothetical protein
MALFLSLAAFAILTLVTQIGGIALFVAWLLVNIVGGGFWRLIGVFLITYALLTVAVVPALAPLNGRVALACFGWGGHYAAANPLYCALNRHYTTPRLRSMLEALAADMNKAYPGTTTLYLDANFPFFDGFPLFPHLSHEDGRKLDLAFYYADAAGQYLPNTVRSPIGYWGFEQPANGASACPSKAVFDLRWDMDWLQPMLPALTLDAQRTRAAVDWLTSQGTAFGVEKLFLEPHLAKRLGVSSPLLRFQGCRAARHDDHIHVQVAR